MKNICKKCGAEFLASKHGKKIFCSIVCRNGGNRLGKKNSEETKSKISKALMGRKPSEETREKMSKARKGKPLSLKNRIGISRALKGKKHKPNQGFQKGRKNSNWNGGISSRFKLIRASSEYKLWREAVVKRDNYACIWCGVKQGWNKELRRQIKVEADHIKRFAHYPELRFAIDNGRTLCQDCHRTTNTWGRPKHD